HLIVKAELTAEEVRLELVELLGAIIGADLDGVRSLDPGHRSALAPTVESRKDETVRGLAAHAGKASDIHPGEALVLNGVIVGFREAERGEVEALGNSVRDAVRNAARKPGMELRNQRGTEDGVGRDGGVIQMVDVGAREVHLVLEGIEAEAVAFDVSPCAIEFPP